ncbi:MAG: COX15/CtaA family protein [Actinomycetales bacterium]
MLSPWSRRLLLLNVIAQIGIVVTGGLVRLTGSGLGCPTWPQCVPGSYTPVLQQAEGFHKYIEFGNRLLTFVVLATAVAVILIGVRQVRSGRPGRLLVPAAIPLALVVAQAVIGGITVLTGLHPATVATHFLVSMLLVAASVYAWLRLDAPDGPTAPAVRVEIRWLYAVCVLVAVAILVLGTVVTGSGPHSGDAETPARFALDPRTVSWLHADLVMAFCGLVIGLLVAVRVAGGRPRLLHACAALVAVTLAQGLIGYVQYFTGLPEALVAAHMLGASLLVVALVVVGFRLQIRLDPEPARSIATATAVAA